MATTAIHTLGLGEFVDLDGALGTAIKAAAHSDECYDLDAAVEDLGRQVAEAINPGEFFEAQNAGQINEGQLSATEGWTIDPEAGEAYFGTLHRDCDEEADHCAIDEEFDGNHCDEDCAAGCDEHCGGCECLPSEPDEDEVQELRQEITEVIGRIDLDALVREHLSEDLCEEV